MKPAVIFDLDGTLIDSLGVTLKILKRIIERESGSPIENSDIVKHFGHPEETIFERFFGLTRKETLLQEYLVGVRQVSTEIRYFRGIPEILSDLNRRGIRVGLYTARGHAATHIIGESLRFSDWLHPIVTGSDVKNGKPHPEGLDQILKSWNLEGPDAVYIGDSPKDVQMAKVAGCLSVGAAWSHQASASDLLATEPDFLLNEVSDLVGVLNQFLK